MNKPRFEIVRTDAGWHARFIGGNGEKVWTTESYTREKAATDAIALITNGQTSLEVGRVDERS